MISTDLVKALSKAGITVTVVIGLLIICFLIVRHILKSSTKQNHSVMSMAKEQILEMSGVVNKLAVKLDNHEKRSSESAIYQKQEHDRMLESQHEISKALITVNSSLKETNRALIRLNGKG